LGVTVSNQDSARDWYNLAVCQAGEGTEEGRGRGRLTFETFCKATAVGTKTKRSPCLAFGDLSSQDAGTVLSKDDLYMSPGVQHGYCQRKALGLTTFNEGRVGYNAGVF
jgi:hypothetical protein